MDMSILDKQQVRVGNDVIDILTNEDMENTPLVTVLRIHGPLTLKLSSYLVTLQRRKFKLQYSTD